ncbi:hypothetical protein C8R45DRAFT_1157303 [Mycena sanguinolenta]|nr:hypothetical protein C8R45DRAFT_1157303 [Mycena sanguinolenta]
MVFGLPRASCLLCSLTVKVNTKNPAPPLHIHNNDLAVPSLLVSRARSELQMVLPEHGIFLIALPATWIYEVHGPYYPPRPATVRSRLVEVDLKLLFLRKRLDVLSFWYNEQKNLANTIRPDPELSGYQLWTQVQSSRGAGADHPQRVLLFCTIDVSKFFEWEVIKSTWMNGELDGFHLHTHSFPEKQRESVGYPQEAPACD